MEEDEQTRRAEGRADMEGRNAAEGSVGLLRSSGDVPRGMVPSTQSSNKPRTSETTAGAEPCRETWPHGPAVTGTARCLCPRLRNRRWSPPRSWVCG